MFLNPLNMVEMYKLSDLQWLQSCLIKQGVSQEVSVGLRCNGSQSDETVVAIQDDGQIGNVNDAVVLSGELSLVLVHDDQVKGSWQ